MVGHLPETICTVRRPFFCKVSDISFRHLSAFRNTDRMFLLSSAPTSDPTSDKRNTLFLLSNQNIKREAKQKSWPGVLKCQNKVVLWQALLLFLFLYKGCFWSFVYFSGEINCYSFDCIETPFGFLVFRCFSDLVMILFLFWGREDMFLVLSSL